ncbi:DGQHR domain-containing protein [Algoriphagus sp. CAU 1675]|uniref:DGQHR domain-containing protein n=1 Tax=Algoriphagus sp. CAU 1675 TaxID=3032597 RepID=UPI0023DA3F7C|nr:DGQHR domain-containing protein [Algoriphagus sp. CAU 1675]MDF2156690.1 DGQHR domain-containing protein [Algoriphagus sp. CAU 1675]
MTEDQKEKFWSSLVNSKNISSTLQRRKKTDLYESIFPESLDRYKIEGWEIDREFKTKVRIKKPKSFDMAFEDMVWSTFANLGFDLMNKDRNFRMPYSDDFTLTQQIDVFAADQETIIFVECKACEGEPKKGNFKEVIEAIGGKKDGIHKAIRMLFPNHKFKVKFILATNNYYLSMPDIERLENFGILHFDEETIQYYQDLTKHLGVSARFQLLGNLFEGQEIPEIQNQIPAIEGKMGGHTYYSFSIEPEKLLKIGYVLHRNKANKKLMPTYQRLIKRTRLNSVQGFVEGGGFFPNSIIVNLLTEGKKIRFERANTQVIDAISRIGILFLPKKYRSAFIIDGQHRLYGYANSEYQKTNSIPVVAFVNLDRKDQVRLFMQINENQKPVPKNLRNTLNSDLLWDSDNLSDQIKALKLTIAQELGEDKSSALYDKVIVGENPKTSTRCITIDTIKIGLDRSNFFGQFGKTSIKEDGTFYKGNNDETYDILFPFLKDCFQYIKECLPEEWQKGEKDDGFLSINAGIENLIRVFNDIIDHLTFTGKIKPKSDSLDFILSEVKYYLDPLIDYFRSLSPEQKIDLRKSYGTGGRVRYWRILQKAISDSRKDFSPKGLTKYWNDEAKAFNEESFKMIRDLETHMKSDFRKQLKVHHGDNWFKVGLPKNVYDESIKRAADKNYEAKTKSEEVEPWDCLNIIDYRKIATYGRNWSEIFEKYYTKPGEEKISGGKEAKTAWMQKLERIRNQNVHSYSVKEDEYEFLIELNEWLIEKKIETDLG